jgi:hypothetical protein
VVEPVLAVQVLHVPVVPEQLPEVGEHIQGEVIPQLALEIDHTSPTLAKKGRALE